MITAIFPRTKIVDKIDASSNKSPLKGLPKDILYCICELLQTNQIGLLTRTCKDLRADEKILRLVCERLGLDLKEQHMTWGSLSDNIKTALRANFTDRLAAKNLSKLPQIITDSDVKEMNQRSNSFDVSLPIPFFVFNCRITRDGILVPVKDLNFKEAQIKLVKSTSISPWTYKLTIESLEDLSLYLSEQGRNIVNTTLAYFNSIFATSYLGNYDSLEHKKQYRFFCTAERPYSIFHYRDYQNWLIIEMQKRIDKKYLKNPKTCLIQ
ncbi:MAG TPA: hypothetical protein VLG49_01870 [Rhabdochlamydiaceae bacterium]|nr:hypothetical protein [Rhabdochlamydiaceae bacterium]